MQPRNRSYRKTGMRGSAFVESALIFMLFLSLSLTVVDAAQFLLLHQHLSEKARGAARRAALENLTVEQVQNILLTGSVASGSLQDSTQFGLSRSNISVEYRDGCLESQRVVISIQNLKIRMMTPMASKLVNIVPVRVTVPVERVVSCPPPAPFI